MIEKRVLSMGGYYGDKYVVPPNIDTEQLMSCLRTLVTILNGKKEVSLIVDYELEPEPFTEPIPDEKIIAIALATEAKFSPSKEDADE